MHDSTVRCDVRCRMVEETESYELSTEEDHYRPLGESVELPLLLCAAEAEAVAQCTSS